MCNLWLEFPGCWSKLPSLGISTKVGLFGRYSTVGLAPLVGIFEDGTDPSRFTAGLARMFGIEHLGPDGQSLTID